MAAVVESQRERVWQALTDPAELMAWDERILATIDQAPLRPVAGHRRRWRYRLGSVQLVMHEYHVTVVPIERLCSEISLGTLRYRRTYTLVAESGDTPRTRLGLKVIASNSVPVMGDVVDRFAVRRMAVEHVDTLLRSVQKWCENHPLNGVQAGAHRQSSRARG
jgi:uncharacterized protein YndB with AHSA1/START domain